MSFFTILGNIFIGPLKLLFEIIFQLADRFVDNPGLSIIFLSLIMNILVLPLYKRADAMQEAARDIDARLHDGVAHIKKSFSGDERMMIMQTYYRQNNYKPTDALNGSVSLLLEIPFFMAAYQFLSHLDVLKGATLGPITDLGSPDGLLVIGGLTLNLLPILMTLINVISSAVYLKGFPLKTKLQLYGIALFFLIFLYESPAGLVFYWTLNNVFSLVKNIFYKLKNPKKVLAILTSIIGLGIIAFATMIYEGGTAKQQVFLIGIGVILQLPAIMALLKGKVKARETKQEVKAKKGVFLAGALFLTVFIGILIPSTFIAASPQEYIDITCFHNPLWYLVSSLSLAAGTFLVWMGVFYWLASPKGKVLFTKLVWILCGVALTNYMFFGTDLGNMSAALQYDDGMKFTLKEQGMNLLILLAVALVLYFIATKWTRLAGTVMLFASVAFIVMSGLNVSTIKKSVEEISVSDVDAIPNFKLSKEGKNVIVLMLDRALNEYVPFLFEENPELAEQFEGFTYYSNTVSHGAFTNFGVPGLAGGYEYTPVEMNKRDKESLVEKHNEALKVMPVTFAEAGYEVTVCDPPYAGYKWIPDLSIYDDYPKINTFITKGAFTDPTQKEQIIENNHRNFFCFSIMKAMPLCVQTTIYNRGNYNQAKITSTETAIYATQSRDGLLKAEGLSKAFMEPYNVLMNLEHMTKITDDGTNTFMFMCNDTTHEPMMLQKPNYTPSYYVDNTEYESTEYTVDGVTLKLEDQTQVIHYQSNMATYIQIGEWLDYLREQGVYDNTKIIIVADHGKGLKHIDELVIDDGTGFQRDLTYYYPLLMVKDFGSDEFTTSEEFMTNADVPTLAMKDAIENPINPFTGKPINSDEKTAHDQFVIISGDWRTTENNGNTFLPVRWASVSKDMRKGENWEFYHEKDIVLKEHANPEK